MIKTVVFISGVQRSDSVVHLHVSILFQILFPFRFSPNSYLHSGHHLSLFPQGRLNTKEDSEEEFTAGLGRTGEAGCIAWIRKQPKIEHQAPCLRGPWHLLLLTTGLLPSCAHFPLHSLEAMLHKDTQAFQVVF